MTLIPQLKGLYCILYENLIFSNKHIFQSWTWWTLLVGCNSEMQIQVEVKSHLGNNVYKWLRCVLCHIYLSSWNFIKVVTVVVYIKADKKQERKHINVMTHHYSEFYVYLSITEMLIASTILKCLFEFNSCIFSTFGSTIGIFFKNIPSIDKLISSLWKN